MRPKILLFNVCVFFSIIIQAQENYIIEAYPSKIQEKINSFKSEIKKSLPPYIGGSALMLLIEDLKLWKTDTLKVSFKGGDNKLHKQIATIASTWEKYANIKFDFGFNPETNTYRTWSVDDDSHIRVGFEYSGYWSLVGTDSKNTNIVSNEEISLNLSKFNSKLPKNYPGIILHEFGHALGFLHEHQGPVDCGFDMQKVYDYFLGYPNYWNKDQVDYNIKQTDLRGTRFSAHDKHSIMHYSFPSWMFNEKELSPCFTSQNIQLSDTDKIMAKEAYPFTQDLIVFKDKRRKEHINFILSTATSKDNFKKIDLNIINHYKQLIDKQ